MKNINYIEFSSDECYAWLLRGLGENLILDLKTSHADRVLAQETRQRTTAVLNLKFGAILDIGLGFFTVVLVMKHFFPRFTRLDAINKIRTNL